jgi:hypothetical protein
MEPSRADRILKDWDVAASAAQRPATPPRPVVVRSGLPSISLMGAGLAVIALLIAVAWLGRPGPDDGVGSLPSTSPSPIATTAPTPSPIPTIGPCDPAALAAEITLWEGAAGHRIADVTLTNSGSTPCTMQAVSRPQLIDGRGVILIDGATPPASEVLTVDAGGALNTLVDTSDYCGPAPTAPVTVAFVIGGSGRIVATPFSPTDATVPPCLSQSGSAGEIQMQPWAP